MPRGGYQQPRNPAPVSGPGKMSRRTDGPLHGPTANNAFPGGPMGPVVAEPAPPRGPAGPMQEALDTSKVVPLDAPSQFPDEPITSGSDLGLGPTSSALPVPSAAQQGMDQNTRQRLKEWMPYLMWAASQPDASPETRQFVRQARGDFL